MTKSTVVKVRASTRLGRSVKAYSRTITSAPKVAGAGKEFNQVKAAPFADYEYDPALRELSLTFHNGAKYIYVDVPRTITKKIEADKSAAMSYIRKTFTYAPDNNKAKFAFNRANKKRQLKK